MPPFDHTQPIDFAAIIGEVLPLAEAVLLKLQQYNGIAPTLGFARQSPALIAQVASLFVAGQSLRNALSRHGFGVDSPLGGYSVPYPDALLTSLVALSDLTFRVRLGDEAVQQGRYPNLEQFVIGLRAAVEGLRHAKATIVTPTELLQPMVSLGDRNYQVAGSTQVVEPGAEDEVLQTYFRRAKRQPKWIGLSKPTLVSESGYEDAPRFLRNIKSKYRILAPAIDCPGKKGLGGIKVYVQDTPKRRKK